MMNKEGSTNMSENMQGFLSPGSEQAHCSPATYYLAKASHSIQSVGKQIPPLYRGSCKVTLQREDMYKDE